MEEGMVVLCGWSLVSWCSKTVILGCEVAWSRSYLFSLQPVLMLPSLWRIPAEHVLWLYYWILLLRLYYWISSWNTRYWCGILVWRYEVDWAWYATSGNPCKQLCVPSISELIVTNSIAVSTICFLFHHVWVKIHRDLGGRWKIMVTRNIGSSYPRNSAVAN